MPYPGIRLKYAYDKIADLPILKAANCQPVSELRAFVNEFAQSGFSVHKCKSSDSRRQLGRYVPFILHQFTSPPEWIDLKGLT